MYFHIRSYPILLTIILLFFLSSCKINTGTHQFSLTPGKTFSFSSQFPIQKRYSKVFNDKSGQAIFCSYNTKTYKQIDLFTLDGKLLKSIPLKDVLTIEKSIYDVAPISTDSFWVLANYSNYVYLIGAEGNILKQIKVDTSVPDSMRAEVRGSMLSGFCINNNTFLFNCVYYYKDEKRAYTLSDYFKANKAHPYFLKMELASDSKITFGLPGFYNRILKDGDAMPAESALYAPIPQGILLTSWYSDSLYLINDKDFSIKKAVKMTSKYSTIGCVPLTTKEFQEGADLNALFNHLGGVWSISYDSFRNLIYIVLRGEADKNATEPSKKKSLLIYNTNLQLQEEIKLDCNIYDLSEMYVIKEGLLINKTDKNNGNITKFQLFHVDKK
ncbi:DUF4221 family protein [Taibaiella lutea]|nr:DUF4221 family protein [Taibaiella lutea]